MSDIALKEIEARKDMLFEMNRHIWENPEITGYEYETAKLYCKVLAENGFAVEEKTAGIPTAFRATWGSGHPVMGFLAEYDALPGMSQIEATHKEPVKPGAAGHACGHNLVGIAQLGAVLGLKKEMEEKNLPGTLVFYGCPGEEGLAGKVFMAREGCFKELDLAFSYHPGRYNGVFVKEMIAVNTYNFHFKGITAHAGLDAYSGRSALDAVELMNVGANYLREHIRPDVRIHYIITHGGDAPNIVPDKASVQYLVRAKDHQSVLENFERLKKVAEGAAMMTETQMEWEIVSGSYPTLYSNTISQVVDEAMHQIPMIEWTDEELAFARALNETTPKEWEEACNKYHVPQKTDMMNTILPPEGGIFHGSTDIGDVTYITPTILLYTSNVNICAPIHSWQATACVGGTIGMKGAIYGAKILATAALKLIENPAIVQKAQEELKERTPGRPYVCPIPKEGPLPEPWRNAQ